MEEQEGALSGGRLGAVLESLLFVASRPVRLKDLARAARAPLAEVQRALATLEQECEARGLRLQRSGDSVQFVTCPEAAPYVERFLGIEGGARLSMAALETLAVIAYEQPVTRARVEAVRGVNSDGVVVNLLARGLVAEVGRAEGPGRPVLFGTTVEFLQYFGLRRPEDLPALQQPPAASAGSEEDAP